MQFDQTIQANEIENFFEGEIPEKVKKHVIDLNLKFRKISDEEYLSQKNKYQIFFEETITPSEPKRKEIRQPLVQEEFHLEELILKCNVMMLLIIKL